MVLQTSTVEDFLRCFHSILQFFGTYYIRKWSRKRPLLRRRGPTKQYTGESFSESLRRAEDRVQWRDVIQRLREITMLGNRQTTREKRTPEKIRLLNNIVCKRGKPLRYNRDGSCPPK